MSPRNWRRIVAIGVLVGLPLASLALCVIGWLRFGVDLPFYDDWRGYANGRIGSLDPAWLFKPVNDTLAPVGFLLDAIAQRVLDGNSVAYQLVSMLVVLGGLLWLQWRLLRAALGDAWHAAICFAFTLPMLQPGSYWGRENLAYHQALPLMALLGALWIAIAAPWRARWRAVAMFALGVTAGLVYISGAFGTLAAGGSLLLLAALRWAPPLRARLAVAGGALSAAGVTAAAAQFFLAVLPVMAREHRSEAPVAWPNDPDFWLFYLGKIGRALMLPASAPAVSLPVVVFASLGLVAGLAWLLRTAPRRQDPRWASVTIVLATLAGVVTVYLLLVASGRTYLRGPDVVLPLDVFAWGFTRFHFFWATLLWPWAAAGVLLALQGVAERRAGPAVRLAGGAAVLALLALFVGGGALAHHDRFRTDAFYRRAEIACLSEKLQDGEALDCPEFNLPDIRPAFIFARSIGASFVRYFPILPPTLGQALPLPWFRLATDAQRLSTSDVRPGRSLASRSGNDAAMHVQVASAGEMGACVMLDVQAAIRVERTDFAQLFWRPLGAREYSEAFSEKAKVYPGRTNVVHFRLENPEGFGDSIRLDPVAQSQEFEVADLEVRCRLLDPRFTGKLPFYFLRMTMRGSPALVKRRNVEFHPNSLTLYRATQDPQLHLTLEQRETMANCALLHAEAFMRTEVPEEAQLYFVPKGEAAYTEEHSVTLPIQPSSGLRTLVFEAQSTTGFAPQLRFDPVRRAANFELFDLHVSCRQRLPAQR